MPVNNRSRAHSFGSCDVQKCISQTEHAHLIDDDITNAGPLPRGFKTKGKPVTPIGGLNYVIAIMRLSDDLLQCKSRSLYEPAQSKRGALCWPISSRTWSGPDEHSAASGAYRARQ